MCLKIAEEIVIKRKFQTVFSMANGVAGDSVYFSSNYQISPREKEAQKRKTEASKSGIFFPFAAKQFPSYVMLI